MLSILEILSPTLNYEVGHIASIPIVRNELIKTDVTNIAERSILIAKTDWDSFETSWFFERHPLI